VLLQKPRVYAEVYNDLDGEIVNFFRVLQCPLLRAQLVEKLVVTPYARAEFDLAWESHSDPVECARRLCIRAQMGFGSAGASKGSTGFRIDTKRDYGTAQHIWSTFPHNLRAVGERLVGVLIENSPAIEVMLEHDAPSTLHYVDPPYLPETRQMKTGQKYYRHELSPAEHLELLEVVKGLQGACVVSGYPSPLYDDALEGWERHQTSARISAGRGGGVRTEVVWINAAGSAQIHSKGLFAGAAA
jgi:DNA adenine methylase